MKDILKGLLLVGVMSVSAGAMAEGGNPSSNLRLPYNDPATGPDAGTPEYERCQARGGCNS
ncbi:Uncharacterised protein [Yersinia aldovae]|uniref:hypothetical protein n=1 Tax=Yersinia aldovae TaxID=29483 RepID=UPI0005E5DA73|nr:hypothetical protein [Yersinia aldovae]CNH77525.1 Uncharacterised protein [Yersinia aldovae]